jgi:hypothetical protein
MDFYQTSIKMYEALTPQQQTDLKKKAVADAKLKNPALNSVSDDQLDYDPTTNTVSKNKLSPQDIAKLKNVKVRI